MENFALLRIPVCGIYISHEFRIPESIFIAKMSNYSLKYIVLL